MEFKTPKGRIISKLWTANVEHVKLSDLTASQPMLRRSLIEALESDRKPPSDLEIKHRRDRPIVVNFEGKLIIWDGHHRLAVSYRKEMSTDEAYVVYDDGCDGGITLRAPSQWGWGPVIVVS